MKLLKKLKEQFTNKEISKDQIYLIKGGDDKRTPPSGNTGPNGGTNGATNWGN